VKNKLTFSFTLKNRWDDGLKFFELNSGGLVIDSLSPVSAVGCFAQLLTP
jgi:hypothetical protein